MERPQGVFQSYDGTTPGGSFSPRMELPQRGHSVLGWNDPRGHSFLVSIAHCTLQSFTLLQYWWSLT